MQDIKELVRHPAPGGRPQPLAVYDGTLWIGCWDTAKLYAIDTKTWTVSDTVDAPGKPYGLVSLDGAMSVVVSLGEDDDRYLYRFAPGRGFDEASKAACPDFTGSQLATDGTSLYLAQMGNGRILVLDAHGTVKREIPLPTRIAGMCFDGGTFYAISADDDFDVLQFGTMDISSEEPVFTGIARVAPEARGLAFDGTSWWTNYRELSETISFTA